MAIGIVDLEGPGHLGVTGRMVAIRAVGLPMEGTALWEVVVVESGAAEGEARLVEVMEADHRVEGPGHLEDTALREVVVVESGAAEGEAHLVEVMEVDHREEGPGHLEDTALTMVILVAALMVEVMDLLAVQAVEGGVVGEEAHLVVVTEEEAHLVVVMEEDHLLVHPEALGMPNVEG